MIVWLRQCAAEGRMYQGLLPRRSMQEPHVYRMYEVRPAPSHCTTACLWVNLHMAMARCRSHRRVRGSKVPAHYSIGHTRGTSRDSLGLSARLPLLPRPSQ
jgi:hypothetical protein